MKGVRPGRKLLSSNLLPINFPEQEDSNAVDPVRVYVVRGAAAGLPDTYARLSDWDIVCARPVKQGYELRRFVGLTLTVGPDPPTSANVMYCHSYEQHSVRFWGDKRPYFPRCAPDITKYLVCRQVPCRPHFP